MNKFSNKFFKYMLGIMLFIGLFFWCDDVFGITCEYTLSRQDTGAIATETGGWFTHTAFKFSLYGEGNTWTIKSSSTVCKYDTSTSAIDPSKCTKKEEFYNELRTDRFSLYDKDYDGAYSFLGNTDVCPKVAIYDRKLSTNFYVLSSNFIDDCKNGSDSHGFDCDNLYDVVEGVVIGDEVRACGDDYYKEVKNVVKEKYSDTQTKINKIVNDTNSKSYDPSQATTNEEKQNICNQINSDYDNAKNSISDLNDNFFNNSNSIINDLKDTLNKQYNCISDEKLIIENFTQYLKGSYNSTINGLETNRGKKFANCSRFADPENADKNISENADKNEEKNEQMKTDFSDSIDDMAEEFYSSWNSAVFGSTIDSSCEGLLGNDMIDLIERIYNYIKIAAPILLLVFGSIDFGGAVISNDKQALEKAFTKFIKRALVCVAIFFVPYIIKWLLSNANIPGLVDDPMCGIK